MVVLLDTTLSENGDFMAHLASELHALEVTYRICQDMHPGSVRWKRIVTDRAVDKSAQVYSAVLALVSLLRFSTQIL